MFIGTPASPRLLPQDLPSNTPHSIPQLPLSPSSLQQPLHSSLVSPSSRPPSRSPLPPSALRHHNNAASGPSFSHFLSNSIINPLSKSRFFPSTVSENPLFYSTREGYEIGLNEQDDILPDEDSLQHHHSLAQAHGRGIDEDEPLDSHESHFFHHAPHYSVAQGKRPAAHPPSAPPDGIYCDEDEDPFYEHSGLGRRPPHPERPSSPHTRLPRHLLASHALSNLMASEIALPNDHYRSAQADQPQRQASSHGGWPIHQSVAQPGTAHGAQDYGPGHSLPSQPVFDRSELTRTTQDLPKHPLLRPVPPERYPELDPEAYPVTTNDFGALVDRPTVYIYPTEARDIGSDVSGQPVLGPQSYRDGFWLAAWLGALVYAVGESLWVLLLSSGPASSGERAARRAGLMASLPVLALLITLTFGLCLVAMALLVLVKRSIRFLVYGTIVGVPSVLGLVGLWTWSESLAEPGATGLGYLSLGTTLVCGLVVRMAWRERARVGRTVRVLELATGVVLEHPSLVLVALALSLASMLMSMPFLTVIYQLVLRGRVADAQWTLGPALAAQLLAAGLVWSWTLNVVRSLERIIIAGVVSHWYFNRHSPDLPGYSGLETTCQAIGRALGPSLGTVCLSGLLLTILDTLSKLTYLLKRLSRSGGRSDQHGLVSFLVYRNPVAHLFWSIVGPVVGMTNRVFGVMNGYTVLYAGVTGFRYWESTRRVSELMSRNGQVHLVNNLLVKTMLKCISLTLSLILSLIGYKIWTNRLWSSSSTLPSEGWGKNHGFEVEVEVIVRMFSGLLPFWIFRFCLDVVESCVDTLFLCWNIDLDIGTNHSSKTREAFTGKDESI